jgi:hypothetical protein
LHFTVRLRKRRSDQVGNGDFPVLLDFFESRTPQPMRDFGFYMKDVEVLE